MIKLGSVRFAEVSDDDWRGSRNDLVSRNGLELDVDNAARNWVDVDVFDDSKAFFAVDIKIDW